MASVRRSVCLISEMIVRWESSRLTFALALLHPLQAVLVTEEARLRLRERRDDLLLAMPTCYGLVLGIREV
jgi:hypothetical protein